MFSKRGVPVVLYSLFVRSFCFVVVSAFITSSFGVIVQPTTVRENRVAPLCIIIFNNPPKKGTNHLSPFAFCEVALDVDLQPC